MVPCPPRAVYTSVLTEKIGVKRGKRGGFGKNGGLVSSFLLPPPLVEFWMGGRFGPSFVKFCIRHC